MVRNTIRLQIFMSALILIVTFSSHIQGAEKKPVFDVITVSAAITPR